MFCCNCNYKDDDDLDDFLTLICADETSTLDALQMLAELSLMIQSGKTYNAYSFMLS